MKYLVIGDPHAKPDNLDKIEQLFDIVAQYDLPTIILGDLLDTKELIRGNCLNTYINLMGKAKTHFYVLVGNHDWFNLECQGHSLEALKILPNVTVIDEPQIINNLTFCPYYPPDKMRKVLPLAQGGALFCHMDTIGFDYGNGHFSETGCTIDEFSGIPLIISGHYHKYQQNKNFIYLGTPFSHSFGESNQTKYIGIYDSDTNKLDLIETDFPKHITTTIIVEKNVKTPTFSKKDYNRVILRGSVESLKRYPRQENVKYIDKIEMGEVSSESMQLVLSPEAQFEKWGKDIKGLSEAVIKLGKEILKDVS